MYYVLFCFFKKLIHNLWECVCVHSAQVCLSHNKVRLINGWSAVQGQSVSVSLAVPFALTLQATDGGLWTWAFVQRAYPTHERFNFLECVGYVCVNLLKSSAAGVCLFRDKADKSLPLSRWSSPQIGHNIIRMKRECGSRGDHFCAWKFISLISGGERKCPLKPACALIFHLHHCVENWVIRLNINPNLFCHFTLSELVLHPQQCLNVTLSGFSVYL